MEQNNFKKGLLINSLSVLLNSIGPLLNKFAMTELTALQAAFWGSLFTFIFSLVWYFFRPFKISLTTLKTIWPILLLNSVGVVLLYSSLYYLNPVIFGFMGRLYIVFTTVLSVLILKEAVQKTEWFLILFAIGGAFLVSLKAGPLGGELTGILLAVAYTFSFALSNLFVKKYVQKIDPMLLLFYNNLSAIVTVSTVSLFSSESLLHKTSYSSLSYILGGSIFTFFAISSLFIGFKYLSFRLANLIRSCSPLVVAAVSWPFFPIKLSLANTFGGLILIFSIVGLGLVEKHKK